MVLSLLIINNLFSQDNARIQSVFIYNFTRMVNWNEPTSNEPFKIAVYRNNSMFSEVVEMEENRQVGSRSIEAIHFQSLDEITNVHVLYIPSNESRRISDIVEILKSKNSKTLIITDSRGALSQGSLINFLIIDSRMRFEISTDNFSTMGITPGNELIRLAF